MSYSDDPRVDETVAKLLSRVEKQPNPYNGRYMTIADIKDVVRHAFGKAAAKAVKITVH